MRPIFQADLVNREFGDPGVYVDLKFERRALLFDIGDITALPTRKLLRISDVFVSHTHMDHFYGFDHLLRVRLGRDAGVRLYGPEGFIGQVEHKLHAYTWNLVENYATDFVVTVCELHGDDELVTAQFSSRHRFRRAELYSSRVSAGQLLSDAQFSLRCAPLDHHGIPSLAFRFEEETHVNVWKNRLQELGLPTGQWLTELKRQVRAGAPDATPIRVHWRTRDGSREQVFALAELRERVLQFVAGQCVAYVTDVAGHESNSERLIGFLKNADVAFIEAVFLHEDLEHAIGKAHLTAHQAGTIARLAGVKHAIPFHFSTRYMGREQELRAEFFRAFQGQ